MDLMLRLIEELTVVASLVKSQIRCYITQFDLQLLPQRSTMGRSTERCSTTTRGNDINRKQYEEPLTVPQIAKILGISQRQLERQFKKNVGCTVVQFSLLKRLQNARLLLISTDMSIRQIATASGLILCHTRFSFGKFLEDDLQIIGRLGQRNLHPVGRVLLQIFLYLERQPPKRSY